MMNAGAARENFELRTHERKACKKLQRPLHVRKVFFSGPLAKTKKAEIESIIEIGLCAKAKPDLDHFRFAFWSRS